MRITGGQYRGVPLFAPDDDAIRPTSDKARQAIFNTLTSGRFDIDLDSAHVLDGTAGTGAMGLEALSRGAPFVHFADPDPIARTLVRKNSEKLRVDPHRYMVHPAAAEALEPGHAVHLIFLDPPYRQNLLPVMVRHLIASGWAHPQTLFVLEEDANEAVPLPLDILDRKYYGAAQVLYARMPK